MRQLSRPQKIYTSLLLGMLAIWLVLKLGTPIYEYLHGRDALTALLQQIATVLGYAVVATGLACAILQRIGVLPAVAPGNTAPVAVAMRRLRNLALWIIIALLLFFLFNLFQAGGMRHRLDDHATGLALQYLPLGLFIIVVVFFALRMSARRKKDLGGSP